MLVVLRKPQEHYATYEVVQLSGSKQLSKGRLLILTVVTFSVTPVPMEHSSDLRAENKVLTVARLYIEPTLPEG